MKLAELALTIPWQITPEALDAMLSIAAREPLPEDEIAAAMHGPQSLALGPRDRREDSRTMGMRNGVAVIPIDGPIYRYADYFTQVSGGITTAQLARDFQAALDDPAVSAILFAIDSPGGEATGIGELSDAIYAARGKKPIAAYVEGYGASAAYHIASAADLVIAADDALLGSIGTIIGVADPSKRQSRTIDFVSSQSPKKRPDPLSEEGRAQLQQLADDMTEVFISKVMRNRGISRQAILDIAGGVLLGQQAVDAGLADRLGSEEGTIRALLDRAAAVQGYRPPFPGPQPSVARPSGPRQENSIMKVSELWRGFFKAAQEEGIAIEPDETPAAPAAAELAPAPAQSARDQEREQRLAELEKQLAEQQQREIETRAAAFADGAIRNRQALPSERQSLVSLYTQLASTEAGTAGLEALVAARPQHSLSEELVAQGAGGALPQGGDSTTMTPERRAELLGHTPLGQAVKTRAA